MGRLGILSALAFASLLLPACSQEGGAPPVEHVGVRGSFIYGGSPDTTHQAVVAIISQPDAQGGFSECTGTIIQVTGTTGFVLTAAHCCNDAQAVPWRVLQGNDYDPQNPAAVKQYPVTDVTPHPGYNGDTKDFCMLQFSGASAATPVIKAMTPAEDDLQVGDLVDFVGYGITDGPQGDFNTLRRHVQDDISELTSLTLAYDQTPGGPCSGDSGGPSLSPVGGEERVSGVTSYGDQNCTQFGVSGRVSGVYNAFIAPYLGGVVAPPTCDDCANASQSQGGACAQANQDCGNNQDCIDLADCLGACADQACVDACASAHPDGIDAYNAVISCICNDACEAECADECGGSSSSTTTTATTAVTSSDATTSTGADMTAGVGGAGGAGATTGAGAGDNNSSGGDEEEDDGDPGIIQSSGCSVGGSQQGGAPMLLGLAFGALALVRRRRAR